MPVNKNNARLLIIIGSILALVGAIIDLINAAGGGGNFRVEHVVGPIVVIVISFLIFIALGILKSRKVQIPLNAWVMLIFVILEIVISGAALFSILGFGIILEIVGTTLLFVLEDTASS